MPEFKIVPPPRDPQEEELQVGPIEAESAAEVYARLEWQEFERRRQAAQHETNVIEMEPPDGGFQFSLRQMLIVVTAISVWLGVLRILYAVMPVLSGLLGFAALLMMFWISTREDQPKILRVVWWGMLLAYLSCSVVAWSGS